MIARLIATLFLLLEGAGMLIGAEVTNTWAFNPLQPAKLPEVQNQRWPRTSVDAFILSALEKAQLPPSAEADKRTLLRRVYFDLIGLPPTPAEVRAFLADPAPQAYEHVVDHLLDSPRYGERRARHWMDVAHFAETHGHDQDRIRTNAWPYRDYLINSFNSDKPYARFVQEQVAGDVLFPEDANATVALGFLAAGPWDESSLRDIREDTIDRQVARYLDRDDMLTTVMQSFTSTTVQCARCHDHKFDPIPQRDYYALQAVFAGVDRANRAYDVDNHVRQKRRELLALRQKVEAGDTNVLLSAAAQTEATAMIRDFLMVNAQWKTLHPEVFVSAGGSTMTRQEDDSIIASGHQPEKDVYTISVATPPVPVITAIRIEALTDANIPTKGPGRANNGNFHLSEIQMLVFEPNAIQPREITLIHPSADFEENGQPIRQAIDKDEKTAWGIYPKVGQPHEAIFELAQPLEIPAGARLTFLLKQTHGEIHLLRRPRLSVFAGPPSIHPIAVSDEMKKLMLTAAAEHTPEQSKMIASFFLKRRIRRELEALPRPSLVYAAAADYEPDSNLKPFGGPRPIQVLKRGEVTKPIGPAVPGALSCIKSLSAQFNLPDGESEGLRRAALARWITAPENPLTWRSIVNRAWHEHFGRGLVDTPNDFGKMGGAPSHPELLDWLALWFRDQAHGSLKQLDRLLVTSSVYRQDCHASATAQSIDADNRLLSHFNRTRLDAEQVRDAVLAVSGGLDLRMGGPSDMQFDLQAGAHVTPKIDYTKFNVDSPTSHRRSVYRFLFRTLPDPFMDALDCPAGDQLTPVRNTSVTVQQALALWNNAFVARQAEHFANRLEQQSKDLDKQVVFAFELALTRPARADESQEFAAYARKHGLASACRVLLNSNEFIFLN